MPGLVGPSRVAVALARPTGGGYPAPTDANAIALIARMVPTPSAQRQYHIDQVFKLLKLDPSSAGSTVYSRMSEFWFTAGHSKQAALLAWKNATYNLVETGGTVAWVADQYVQPDGVGSFLNSALTPSTFGGGLANGSISFGAVIMRPQQIGTGYVLGSNSTARINGAKGAASGFVNNGTAAVAAANTNDEGSFMVLNRTTTTRADLVKDTDIIATDATVATALTATPIWIGRYSTVYCSAQVGFAFVGVGFTAAELSVINEAVQYWLVNVVHPIQENGDSLTFGVKDASANQSPYNRCANLAARTGRFVANYGKPGATSADILVIFLRSKLFHRCAQFWNAGRNAIGGNFSTTWITQAKNDAATFVSTLAALGNSKFIITSVYVGNYPVEYLDGGAQRGFIDTYNADQAVTYGSKWSNSLPTAIAYGAPAGPYPDATSYGHSVTPSGIRFDNLHGADIGATNPMYANMADFDYAALTANGF